MTLLQSIWQILLMLLAWTTIVNLTIATLGGLRRGILTLHRLHQIPCSHCRFFVNSPYLKCPIHPTIALSEQAIDCRDYDRPASA
jgi:hypothetical protein